VVLVVALGVPVVLLEVLAAAEGVEALLELLGSLLL
jgi:hypothetical protein